VLTGISQYLSVNQTYISPVTIMMLPLNDRDVYIVLCRKGDRINESITPVCRTLETTVFDTEFDDGNATITILATTEDVEFAVNDRHFEVAHLPRKLSEWLTKGTLWQMGSISLERMNVTKTTAETKFVHALQVTLDPTGQALKVSDLVACAEHTSAFENFECFTVEEILRRSKEANPGFEIVPHRILAAPAPVCAPGKYTWDGLSAPVRHTYCALNRDNAKMIFEDGDHGAGVDAMDGAGVDAMDGAGVGAMDGAGVDAMDGIGVDAMDGLAVDAMDEDDFYDFNW
jgi:hypothetical protein